MIILANKEYPLFTFTYNFWDVIKNLLTSQRLWISLQNAPVPKVPGAPSPRRRPSPNGAGAVVEATECQGRTLCAPELRQRFSDLSTNFGTIPKYYAANLGYCFSQSETSDIRASIKLFSPPSVQLA